MERLTQRITLIKKALITLQKLENEPESKVRHDASIQRFEYSFEAIWRIATYSRRVYNAHLLKAIIEAMFRPIWLQIKPRPENLE